ncbi:MAG: hypothetical protein HOB26_03870 [Flavobacteriales bacterium]|jgi:tetratricopeptide (TPR) repeat protein|nr:hypothetical protein [Flavobacteriales bacterium]
MIKTKHILFSLVVSLFFMTTDVWGQEKAEEPLQTETDTISPVSTDQEETDGLALKVPLVLATKLCVEAESLKKRGKHEEAIQTYTEALEESPEHYPAFIGRAGTKFLKLDFQGALADYDAGITMMVSLKEKYETQAKIKKVFGDVTGQKIELDYANEITPALADGYYQRGNVKQFMDDLTGACDDIKKAKELGHNQTDYAMKDICAE